MKTSAEYLEAAEIEELAERLSAEGYHVYRPQNGSVPKFDLIAEKPGRKIAYEIKAPGSLRHAAGEIGARQRWAKTHGFDAFRLVVVPPPHRTEVEIDGLDAGLVAHLSQHVPIELQEVASRERVAAPPSPDLATVTKDGHPIVRVCDLGVRQIDFDKIKVGPESVRVSGDGVILFGLEYDYLVCLDGTTSPIVRKTLDVWEYGFPFRFDVTLDRNGRVTEAHRIAVDPSSYYEDNGIEMVEVAAGCAI